jgi:probable HAF family extracellular repeat protein
VLWENGKVQALPTVDGDPDGDAFWINDKGQAVGDSGNCTGTILHAVSWGNGTASRFLTSELGLSRRALTTRAKLLGQSAVLTAQTQYGTLWQNDTLTNLGLLPGDFGGLASGINNKGQVVGSNFDSNFNWSHGFIWQNNVMTDLNTLFPASSNLFAVMANKINERGQISGMAIVLSGPDAGNIHAFLATPAKQSMGLSVADVVRTHPKSKLPANAGEQHLQRFGLIHFGR